jgi:hypothetical protein
MNVSMKKGDRPVDYLRQALAAPLRLHRNLHSILGYSIGGMLIVTELCFLRSRSQQRLRGTVPDPRTGRVYARVDMCTNTSRI